MQIEMSALGYLQAIHARGLTQAAVNKLISTYSEYEAEVRISVQAEGGEAETAAEARRAGIGEYAGEYEVRR